MTTKSIATLDPNSAGDGLIIDPGNLKFTSGSLYTNGRVVLGTLPQSAGEFSYQCYFWSTLRNSLAGLVSYGIAQPTVDLTQHVGNDAGSLGVGFFPGSGSIKRGNAVIGTVNIVEERVLLGLHVFLSGVAAFVDFTVNGNIVFSTTLALGKQWVPALSIGSTTVGDITCEVGFGKNRFDNNIFPFGWSQLSPGLAAMYLSLATEAFHSGGHDSPSNQPYNPVILDSQSISVKRAPQAWMHRGPGKSSTGALTAVKLDNSEGTFNALIGADVRDSALQMNVIDSPQFSSATSAGVVATTMLTSILDAVTQPNASTIQITQRDTLARLDKPCPVRIIPGFYDDASAGKIWPIGIGAQRNTQPLLLDASKNLYALGDCPMTNVTVVSDQAAPLDPNALPPQYLPGLGGAALMLAAAPVGRLACDCSSIGTQYAIPGATDVLAGAGNFFPWSATVNVATTTPPPGFTWSNLAGSTLMKLNRPASSTSWLARVLSAFAYSPLTPDREGDYLQSTTTPFIGGRSYRVTFKLPNAFANPPLGSGQYNKIKGGIMLRTALGSNPADAITPHAEPISQALPYGQSYTFDFTCPPGASRPLYIIGVASGGATSGSANGVGGGDICEIGVELLGQLNSLPLEGVTLQQAIYAVLVDRCGEDPSIFSAADCAAIDAAAGYTIGLRWEDQPNVLDMLTTIADQFGAVLFTDALGVIRFRRLTDNNDGTAVVATFSRANIELDSFIMVAENPVGLTTLYGARHNCAPFQPGEFVTDTNTVPPTLREQYKGTSQFNVQSNVSLAQEYVAAIGAGRNHTYIDDRAAVVAEGNRVSNLFATKHVVRQFMASYDGLSLGLGPTISPEQLFYNDKISIDLSEMGWVGERMTVIGTELFFGANKILITVRH